MVGSTGCTAARIETALCTGYAASLTVGGFGFEAGLLGLGSDRALVPLPQPSRVVEDGRFLQRETKLLDRGELPDPEELLLERPDRTLGPAVVLRLTHEGRRAGAAAPPGRARLIPGYRVSGAPRLRPGRRWLGGAGAGRRARWSRSFPQPPPGQRAARLSLSIFA